MAVREPLTFTRLADGTSLLRQADGTYRPVRSASDRAALAALSPDAIELMATDDPDHPTLDEAFWAGVDVQAARTEAISIELDEDVLSFFRRQGRGYQTRINAVLRRYVEAQK